MQINAKSLKKTFILLTIFVLFSLIIYNSILHFYETDFNENYESGLCIRPYLSEEHVHTVSQKYMIENAKREKVKEKLNSCNDKTNQIKLVSVEHIFQNGLLNQTLVKMFLNAETKIKLEDLTNEHFIVSVNYTHFNNSKVKCYLTRFDKEYNINEILRKFNEYEKIRFRKSDNHKILTDKSGTYHVNCSINETTSVYDDTIIIMPINMARLIKKREKFKVKENLINVKTIDNRNKNAIYKNPIKAKKKMNLLIIGFDSMSYRHFNRTLPLTMELLNKMKHTINYNNFNSVGDNTYYNLLPFFTGISGEESPEIEISNEVQDYLNMDESFFDKLPFIWNNFESEGYLTMMQEDQPAYSTFNYNKKGFRSRPTAIYGRGFWTKYYSIKTGPWLCHNGIPMFDTFFDFLEQFIDRMNMKENRDIPYFSFNFLTDYTHDDIVVPPSLDLRVSRMLKRFDENGYLDNTLLIIMGDHGHRLSSFGIYSDVGKAEKYRPFLNIKLPKPMWDTNFENNAKLNKDRLVGMFDLYQTMRHFLHLNEEYVNKNEYNQNNHKVRHLRGISIFENVPSKRFCSDALIPFAQCTCGVEEKIEINKFSRHTSITYDEISNVLLNFVGKITKDYRNLCVNYKFEEIKSIKRKIYGDKQLYFIEFVLQPGDSIFSIVSTFKKTGEAIEYETYGKIIRLSVYGNQSHCIDNSDLKNYCYCKDLLKV